MTVKRFRTNLRCGGCVATIAPAFDAAPGISRWSADTALPEKLLTVEGDAAAVAGVPALLAAAGYQVLSEVIDPVPAAAPPPAEPKTSYFPLVLIVGYLLAVVAAVEVAAGGWDAMRAMSHFMAGFFLAFSFFKLLNLRGFADSYRMYDVLAAAWPGWGFVYPFAELGLGLAYAARVAPAAVNGVTLVVMGVSTVGVARSVLSRKKIRCACLGTVFNLPMSAVTLVEDLLMVAMAAAMLAMM